MSPYYEGNTAVNFCPVALNPPIRLVYDRATGGYAMNADLANKKLVQLATHRTIAYSDAIYISSTGTTQSMQPRSFGPMRKSSRGDRASMTGIGTGSPPGCMAGAANMILPSPRRGRPLPWRHTMPFRTTT